MQQVLITWLSDILFWSLILIVECTRGKQVVLKECLVALQSTAQTYQPKIHNEIFIKFSLKIGTQHTP